MKRLVLLVLLPVLFSACARSASEPTRHAATSSAEPTATLRALYGRRFLGAELHAGGGYGQLRVRLASGEPTETEPFVALASLVRLYPGQREYQLSYLLPHPVGKAAHRGPTDSDVRGLNTYRWWPVGQKVEWAQGDFDEECRTGTGYPCGTATAIDTKTIEAIASGAAAVPVFRD